MSNENIDPTSDPLVPLDRFGLNRARNQSENRSASVDSERIQPTTTPTSPTKDSPKLKSSSNLAVRAKADMKITSAVEEIILNSRDPIKVDESSKISVNGHSGIWANKYENLNWKAGPIPLENYPLMNDPEPTIITKKQADCVKTMQEVAYKYLKPPAPQPAGDLILKREADIPAPIAPPVIIRVHPEEPKIPEPVIIRELPPKVPAHIPSQTITLPGKILPATPRKVVVEKLPPVPAPPPKIVVERWLGYPERTRNVIFQESGEKVAPPPMPRNLIIEWLTPCQEVKQEFIFGGLENVDPSEYILKYGGKLTPSNELPKFVSEFNVPQGESLAVNMAEPVTKLIGNVDCLKNIDLDKVGLGQYKYQVAIANANKK